MNGSGKHFSLLRYGNNYCRKKFYSAGLKFVDNFYDFVSLPTALANFRGRPDERNVGDFPVANVIKLIFLNLERQVFSQI